MERDHKDLEWGIRMRCKVNLDSVKLFLFEIGAVTGGFLLLFGGLIVGVIACMVTDAEWAVWIAIAGALQLLVVSSYVVCSRR